MKKSTVRTRQEGRDDEIVFFISSSRNSLVVSQHIEVEMAIRVVGAKIHSGIERNNVP